MTAPLAFTLGEALPQSAARHPDKACFLFPDGTEQSFALTNSRVNRLVSALRAQGIGRGDRLAVLALDSHRYVEIVLACLKVGAVYLPLNYRLMRPEVDVFLDRAQPVAMFHDARYAGLLAGLTERHPSLRLVVELETGFDPLLETGEDLEPPVVCTDEDLLGLAFTSGTTGLPKGVLQSQGMMKAIIEHGMITNQPRPDDIRYVAAPAFHVTGIAGLLGGVATGFTSLLLPQFDAATVLGFMAEDRVTGAFLVPTMISTLLQQPGVADHSYDRLRLLYYGAAPMSPTLLRRAMDVFDCEFLQLFGAGTEAGLQAFLTPEEHRLALAGRTELLGSIGRPGYGIALRLVDEDMIDVPDGEVGEIATRSDMMMDGYLDMPEETERAFRDGWFRAGDMAYRDKDGYLYLHGRKKDMIIRGGENIYPVEIETVLAEHPAVVQCAVVGVPDEHWGETVRAFVTAPSWTGTDEELAAELVTLCRDRLARYKVPAEVVRREELPMNASGKILKRELRRTDS
ncbi:class I adenylate-forming enzyme family protein [Pseudonocardia pini]|uniref:class I adenylate-forming enzyme family protein n=1 Tax=Pseudonocardia pini TaxID=2758030 RepID=UPI0015F0BB14|nr:AMP-binding protein [Pseudonocardia pini]